MPSLWGYGKDEKVTRNSYILLWFYNTTINSLTSSLQRVPMSTLYLPLSMECIQWLLPSEQKVVEVTVYDFKY